MIESVVGLALFVFGCYLFTACLNKLRAIGGKEK